MQPSQKKTDVYSVNASKQMCVFWVFFSSCTFHLFPSQVLQDCMRHHSSIVEIGKLWVSLSITVVLIYLCSYVCPIRAKEASSFNCAHQTLCPLLSHSGPPPWPIWAARVHLFQDAVHKNGISRKGVVSWILKYEGFTLFTFSLLIPTPLI